MDDKVRRQQDYLLKAKQAEEEAAKTQAADSKAGWLKIAASYRQLAKTT